MDPLSPKTYEEALQAHRESISAKLALIDSDIRDGNESENQLRKMRDILESGLFDPEFYLQEHPDVRQAGIDPLIHYIQWGEREEYEYQPNPVFHPGVYRRMHLAGEVSGFLALEHYIHQGEQARLRASFAFEPGGYLEANPPLAGFVDRPLFHFLKIGRPARLNIRPIRGSGKERPRIAAYLGVKDEVELIERTIAHLRTVGVDYIMACDMSSTDGTAEQLEKYRSDDFTIITLTNQALGVSGDKEDSWASHCLKRCVEAPADWVIFLDADEFWLPASGSLKECATLHAADVLSVERFNVVLGPDGPLVPREMSPSNYDEILLFAEPIANFHQQKQRDPNLPWLGGAVMPKTMAKLSMLEGLAPGQHDVCGDYLRRAKPSDLVIAHLPFSTRARFERKVTNIRAIYDENRINLSRSEERWQNNGSAWHWRRWASLADLGPEFDSNVTSLAEIAKLRSAGIIQSARQMLAHAAPGSARRA
jgi:glycosyltransferase involved in cell wall biosynthesis